MRVGCGGGASASPSTHTHTTHTHVYTYASCIAVRSDDRNDSNHRLTSGIRHSGFRVATPAAIVAVYDCRARSPSPSVDDSSSSTTTTTITSSSASFASSSFLPPSSPGFFSLSLPSSTFTFLPHVPPRTRGLSFLVSFLRLVSALLSSSTWSLPFPPRSFTPPLSLSHSFYPSHPLYSCLLLVSSVLPARTSLLLSRSFLIPPFLPFVRSRSYAL